MIEDTIAKEPQEKITKRAVRFRLLICRARRVGIGRQRIMRSETEWQKLAMHIWLSVVLQARLQN